VPEPGRARDRRVLLAVLAAAVVLVLLTVSRGPVALLAAATLAVGTGALLALPPLLRHDGIDWRWRPGRTDDLPPEPGIARLRRLVRPAPGDLSAAAELQDLVRTIAEDRSRTGAPVPGRLSAYLSAPARTPDLGQLEALVTDLETLTSKETS
jgi:hypothetical protein